MMRYLRLYLSFVSFSCSKAFEFRIDFWFRVVMDVAYYMMSIAFFEVLFMHTASVGGWSIAQARVFISIFFIADALKMTFVANSMHSLPDEVNRGSLDYHLIRPVSALFMLSFREFAANSFINVLIAMGIFVGAVYNYPETIAISTYLLFVLSLGIGVTLGWLLHLMFLLPVFFAHSGRGFEGIFYTMHILAERPDAIYSGAARVVLTTVVPFALMASFPARVLFGESPWTILGHMAIVLLGVAVLMRWLWAKALAGYASASS